MDSDEEHDHEHDQDDGGTGDSQQTTASLTGFLFGNIDKEGRLEDDVLDEVIKIYILFLSYLQDTRTRSRMDMRQINCSKTVILIVGIKASTGKLNEPWYRLHGARNNQ